jgi:hypothetical protein
MIVFRKNEKGKKMIVLFETMMRDIRRKKYYSDFISGGDLSCNDQGCAPIRVFGVDLCATSDEKVHEDDATLVLTMEDGPHERGAMCCREGIDVVL